MFSDLPFNAVDISHKKGKIDNNDTVINDKCIKNPFDAVFKFFISLNSLFYNLYCLFSKKTKFITDITSTINNNTTEAAEANPKSKFSKALSYM